jgi:hypothetical protein
MGNKAHNYYFHHVLADNSHTLFYGSPSFGMSVDMGNAMIIGPSGAGKLFVPFVYLHARRTPPI